MFTDEERGWTPERESMCVLTWRLDDKWKVIWKEEESCSLDEDLKQLSIGRD